MKRLLGSTLKCVELAADIVIGIWLQVMRGVLERRAASGVAVQALDAVLRFAACPSLGRSESGLGRVKSAFAEDGLRLSTLQSPLTSLASANWLIVDRMSLQSPGER